MKEPVAKKIPYEHEMHKDVRIDPYYWLKDRENEKVINYLEEENEYYEHKMGPLHEEIEEIYQRMVKVIPESEERIPIQKGPYFYYYRFEKEKQYPIYVRKNANRRQELENTKEEIVLDENELVEDGEYLNVSTVRMDPSHQKLAYLENRDGSDRYTLKIKNVQSGQYLPERIENVYFYASVEWSKCGQFLFYVTVDEKQRPFKLYRHKIGTDSKEDVLLYEETDDTFSIYLQKSMSGEYIFLYCAAKITQEVYFIKADEPEEDITVFQERNRGIEYYLEHDQDQFLLLTNENAVNFKLVKCSLHDFTEQTVLIEPNDQRYLLAMYPFEQGLLIYGRENSLSQVWTLQDGNLKRIPWKEEIYQVSVPLGQSYDADEILIEYESMITPKTTYSFNVQTKELTTIQVAPVYKEYNKEDYVQRRLWATAEDGEQIPLTITYRKGALDQGPAPLILYGYGSYGANMDPSFNPYAFPILDLGIVSVTTHIRGGSEKGRMWYEKGKMMEKKNTFTDFISSAKFLIDEGYTTKELMAAQGGSAGGLLIGAVANMAGELFNVLVPEVPFVDVLTTMLDESLPLTASEWDEWGDPREKEAYYYIKSYSPYDNVKTKDYPHMYVTAGLNDPRVPYWEPAKWVAKLRDMKTDANTIVLKTNMGAGHFGSSGRLNFLKEFAELYAFVLNKLGVSVK